MRKQMRDAIILAAMILGAATSVQAQCSEGTVLEDGVFENGLGFGAAVQRASLVMRFQPTPGTRLTAVCICWKRYTNAPNINFSLNVWRADGPGGVAGTLLGTVPGLTGTAPVGQEGQFTRYELPAPLQVDGPVYIGPSWVPNQNQSFFLCMDESFNTPRQGLYSYSSTSSSADQPPTTETGTPNSQFPFARAFGIRPVFAAPLPATPAAPQGLSVITPSPTTATLSWQDTSSNEDAFRVELSTSGGAFQEVGTTSPNVTSATFSNLTPSTSYAFRVRASNASGFSEYSNTASVTTPAAPAPPPPTGPWLISSQLPGFQFKVRINGAALGTQVADCVPETLCVAGAIPTRSELFLRIIGPRPNGFLWAQVIRFSPSRLEVWVQRVSGGPIRYYDLPAVPLESSTLDGLVDKEAFQP
jgi:hypothetical protein